MNKFEWDEIHEVGYVCGIISTLDDREKLEHVRDWCQYRIDHDFSPTTFVKINPENISAHNPCIACGGFHGNLPCPKLNVTCKSDL